MLLEVLIKWSYKDFAHVGMCNLWTMDILPLLLRTEPKAADSTSPAQPTSTAPKNLETRLSAANIPNENQHKAGKRSHRENSSGKKKKIKQHTE